MDLGKLNKILIIRLSSLGDILLTTPFIRTIKKKNPQINIDFIIREEFTDTIKHNPHISNLITLERNYNSKNIQKTVLKNNYDLIVDLQNNLRSRRITNGASCSVLRYRKPYLKRLLLVKLKINRFKNIIPISERYANSIPDFKLDEGGLELFLPENLTTKLDQNEVYIGMCPGSKHKTKMWPKDYYIELGNQLSKKGFKILLFGGKEDRDICSTLNDEIESSLDLSNDNDLLDLAANMKICKAVICNDSGLMHTALAVRVPVITIFGSTVKEFGFAPYKGHNLVLENNSVSCRPCSHIGLDECPKSHLDCMYGLDPNYVLNESLKFIETI